MFNLKYNAINILKVILSALNILLMLRMFGASKEADMYLVSTSIILSVHYIMLLFIGQFMQFYNDLKVESVNLAKRFYNQSLLFSFLIGLIIYLISFIFLKQILHIYTLNLDIERFNFLYKLIFLLLPSVIFAPLITLEEQFFIAEKKFHFAYFLHILIVGVPVLALVLMEIFNKANIFYLGLSYSLAIFSSALFGILVVHLKYIPFKFVFKLNEKKDNFKKFLKNSFTMYLGNSIGVFFGALILNNFLVNFSSGVISTFYYAKNGIEATHLIATDFANKNLCSIISFAVSKRNLDEIKNVIKKFLKFAPFAFFIMVLVLYLLFPICFKIIFFNTEFKINIDLFRKIFLSLSFWYVCYLISFPYFSFNSYLKKSKVIILANIFYSLTLAMVLFLNHKNIYLISLFLLISQFVSLIIYYFYSKKSFKEVKIAKS